MASEPIQPRPPSESGAPVVHVHLKVVPGASSADLAGRYGERLKVRVTAAAESGKANQAVLSLLATRLDLPRAALTLVRGTSTPLKTIEIRGRTVDEVRRLLLESTG